MVRHWKQLELRQQELAADKSQQRAEGAADGGDRGRKRQKPPRQAP